MINLILQAANFNAEPQAGNYTTDAETHVVQAEALSTILLGDGWDVFETWNDTIRQNVLSLLHDEIKRARQALRAEQNARQVQP